MRRAGLIAIVLCGCGHLGFEAIDGADDDGDADGVLDDVDNCPSRANPDQANEDGDVFGDVCDPCPPFPEPDSQGAAIAFADSDGDGVGDACDPFKDTPGDKLVVFDGFHAGVAPAGAEIVGTWRFENGQAVTLSATDQVHAVTWRIDGPSETVSTRATYVAAHGSDARPVGVAHRFDPSQTSSIGTVRCVFGFDPAGPTDPDGTRLAALARGESTVLDSAEATSKWMLTNGVGWQRSTRTGGVPEDNYECLSDLIGRALGGTSMPEADNRVGLFARSASARFDWVMIVKSP